MVVPQEQKKMPQRQEHHQEFQKMYVTMLGSMVQLPLSPPIVNPTPAGQASVRSDHLSRQNRAPPMAQCSGTPGCD